MSARWRETDDDFCFPHRCCQLPKKGTAYSYSNFTLHGGSVTKQQWQFPLHVLLPIFHTRISSPTYAMYNGQLTASLN